MDWNWFFSSLAQSAASITGILGAFIIAKISSTQTDFSEKKKSLKELLAVAEKIKADVDATLKHNIGFIRNNTLLNEWANVETKETIKSLKHDANHQIRLISIFFDSIEGNYKSERSSVYLNYVLILIFFLFYFGVFLPLNYLPTPKDWVPPVISSQQQMMRLLFSPFLSNTPFFGDDATFSTIHPAINNIKHLMLMAFLYIFFSILFYFFMLNIYLNGEWLIKFYGGDIEKLKLFKSIENYASEDYADYFVNKC